MRSRRARLARGIAALVLLSMTLPLVMIRCATPQRGVVVWHSFVAASSEDLAVREVLGTLAAEGRAIRLEVVAMGEMLGLALAEAGRTGELPDLVLAPAEWGPTLYRAGLLHTFALEAADGDLLPAVRAALVRQDRLIALPAFASTVALGRHASLGVGAWPATVAELAAQAARAKQAGQGDLYWPAGDPYYTVPWLLAAGGRLEAELPGGADPEWTALPAVDRALLEGWLETVGALGRVAAPEAPASLTLAWAGGDLSFAPLLPDEYAALRAAGLGVELGPLPGGTPLLAVWGLMALRTTAEVAPGAVELMGRLRQGGDDGFLYLSLSAGMLPVRLGQFDSELVRASGLDAYKDAAWAALPMPSGLYAAEIWSSFEAALEELHGGAKASEAAGRLLTRIDALGKPAGN
jgi:hypothetical protein